MRCLSKALYAWERVQVELHGQYSVSRLQQLLEYSRHTSRWQTALIIIQTPLASMLVNVALDALPMEHPNNSDILHQTGGFYFRVYFTGAIMAFLISSQIHTSSPTLPFRPIHRATMTTVCGGIGITVYILHALLIGFPTPFALQVATGWWFVSFMIMLWLFWRSKLRTDAVARSNVLRYLNVFFAQVCVVFIYSFYNFAYTSVPSQYQPLVSVLLPVIKLSIKNWVNKGVYHMEDLAPVVVVFNMDVFHAVFVSSTMQQAKNIGSLLVIITVDTVQSCIAFYEMSRVVRKAHRYTEALGQSSKPDSISSVQVVDVGIFAHAMQIIDTHERIRNHPKIALPRHLRHQSRIRRHLSRQILPAHWQNPTPINSEVSSAESSARSTVDIIPTPQRALNQLSREENCKLGAVQNALHVLHMVEFYVLTEFAEFIVALVYTTYLLMMAQLPNRQYYEQLRYLTQDELIATAAYVGKYACYELGSFLLLCALLNWRLRPFSTMQLLAFVLRKHRLMVQSTILMWVFFIAQFTLTHHGPDYTFQFKWLHKHV